MGGSARQQCRHETDPIILQKPFAPFLLPREQTMRNVSTANPTSFWHAVQVMVGEPSVTDTVQILRGLKEKYASHHGVQIADRALVMAAELADRYITNRFLPGACAAQYQSITEWNANEDAKHNTTGCKERLP